PARCWRASATPACRSRDSAHFLECSRFRAPLPAVATSSVGDGCLLSAVDLLVSAAESVACLDGGEFTGALAYTVALPHGWLSKARMHANRGACSVPAQQLRAGGSMVGIWYRGV
ncbi:unnamed protein product, partial [Ectocarpus fasciculatus]